MTTDDVAIENSQIFRRWLLNSFTSLHIKLAIMFGALHCSPFEESVVEKALPWVHTPEVKNISLSEVLQSK